MVTDIKDRAFKDWCSRNGLWAVTSDLKAFNEAVALGHAQAAAPDSAAANVARPAAPGPHEVPGLGSITDEDDGVVTLRFKNEAAAQAFMQTYSPTVDYRDMPELPESGDMTPVGRTDDAGPGNLLAGVICWIETDDGLCQAERTADKIRNDADVFVRLSTVKDLLASVDGQRDVAAFLRAKLDALWANIEQLIAAHTGRTTVGEPLDVLEGLMADVKAVQALDGPAVYALYRQSAIKARNQPTWSDLTEQQQDQFAGMAAVLKGVAGGGQ